MATKKQIAPITLEYFDGHKWNYVSTWQSEELAWISLGGDDISYRTLDANGNVLTDKSPGF